MKKFLFIIIEYYNVIVNEVKSKVISPLLSFRKEVGMNKRCLELIITIGCLIIKIVFKF